MRDGVAWEETLRLLRALEKYVSRHRCGRAIAAVLLGVMASVAGAQPAPQAFEPLSFQGVKPLPVTPIGSASSRPWITLLTTIRSGEQGRWQQLITYKKDGRRGGITHFAALDGGTGEVRELGTIPGMECLTFAEAQGKMFLGMNLPAHLGVYEPRTGQLQDLGLAFEKSQTLYRMFAGGDGAISLGGNHPAEVSVIDAASLTLRKYGPVGPSSAGYAYWINHDRSHIYVATRGSGDWELVAIERQSGQRRTILTAPNRGFMRLSPGFARTRQHDQDAWKWHALKDGLASDAEAPSGAASKEDDVAQSNPLEVVLDPRPALAGRSEVTLHSRLGRDAPWRAASFAVSLSSQAISKITVTTDGRLAANGGAYNPLLIVDPNTGQTQQIPMPTVSAYFLISTAGKIFVGGYPTAIVVEYDPARPITYTQAIPGEPLSNLPIEDARSNPRLIRYFGQDLEGAHIATQMFVAHDGRVIVCGRRHRYFTGFDFAWFDPRTGKTGTLDDGGQFDQFQVGWAASMNQGKALAVSTTVRPDPQRGGAVTDSGRLFIVDVESNRVAQSYTPLPGVTTLTGVTEVAPDELVGLGVQNPESQPVSILYRMNWKTGQVSATRRFAGLIQGLPGTTGLPGQGPDFITGADGFVWTGCSVAAETSGILRIDPTTLAVQLLGSVPGGHVRYAFHNGSIYITGAPQIRRLEWNVGR